MKQILSFLLVFTIIGCNSNYKKGDLLGTWELVSLIDIETGDVEWEKIDKSEFVLFRSDSLYLISDTNSDKVFAWQIMGDSIVLDEMGSVYIKELTVDKLIVEYDFFGMTRLELKKENSEQ
ncbi:hypothetical protein [Gaetbulibacter saemankumensis]|uniref:hypothetical protein n=1 Tax=Gaetbulibacter saemankumensis TaxID=311208 RepID=UPI0004886357|nr:hypothetical protein [Gaetbulibacter saemankumensis]